MFRAVGSGFGSKNLFENFKYDKVDFNYKDSLEICGSPYKETLPTRIFREGLKVILNDIIDNNVTFELPTEPRKSNIHIKRYSDEDFAKGRQCGKWQDVDFLESNFTGYQMVFSYQSGATFKEKPIYLCSKLKNKITENTNKGKQYC